ncbi:DNA polymerase IV [Sansalvadorimonas sp. 2012CJ34-2]|uniref:DNA polymerase IV n=1 Tax=Parendozoicomonas callyspongiae TaxID=2942213 RepID=A0ABT0PHI1_9GAMM|nr:DNA polymerase IV [Sansalvadorimonas sp. 2012CJ34-2]MCL6270706.1 DNA polymerase IV [Sansalvadorimonas sp. 2012CJ34-2]
MSFSQRKIIHVDCDCFYAAVEIRENPRLRGRPVAVGGTPERRGVIATCNYEAREYGVHSAMASARAVKLCPDLEILRPKFDLYKEVSRELHQIFSDYTGLIEPLSLDEAFLDVSNSSRCHGSATLMAREIKARAKEKTGITVSAGVAPNKFLAKVASDWNKPDGLMVITPDMVDEFVAALPVKKLFGVGKATAKRMGKLGIETCGDVRNWSLIELTRKFGIFGERLYQLSRGIDDRPVVTNYRRKSLSLEHTYNEDLPDRDAVIAKVPLLVDELVERYQRIKDEYAITKRFVKVKFADFTQTTMEEPMGQSDSGPFDVQAFHRLMETAWERAEKPVRLLGAGVRLRDLKNNDNAQQLDLFPGRKQTEAGNEKWSV